MSRTNNIEVIRVDGMRDYHPLPERGRIMAEVHRLIDCEVCSTVHLRDGRIMLVDDTGALTDKPVNPEATTIYHGVCRPGTTWQIRGDVAIVWDSWFGEDK